MANNPTSTSSHRSKIRRFGPCGRDANDQQNSLLSSSPSHLILPSVLSNAVQTSLLHVGMRVRKSVQDGYKYRGSAKEDHYGELALAHPYQSVNELAPFWGISKSTRKVGRTATAVARNEDDLDMLDFPSSSQESNSSTATTRSAYSEASAVGITNKRSLDDEDDEDDAIASRQQSVVPLYPIFQNAASVRHQQQRLPLAPTRQGRILAMPRSRTRKVRSETLDGRGGDVYVDDIEVAGGNAAGHRDFDEVDFLVEKDEL